MKRWGRWLWLVLPLVICEYSIFFMLITWATRPYDPYTHPHRTFWTYGPGKIAIFVPHEPGGKFPTEMWFAYLRGSYWGIGMHFGKSGLPPNYMSATIIVLPMWLPALLGVIGVIYAVKRDGLVIPASRRR